MGRSDHKRKSRWIAKIWWVLFVFWRIHIVPYGCLIKSYFVWCILIKNPDLIVLVWENPISYHCARYNYHGLTKIRDKFDLEETIKGLIWILVKNGIIWFHFDLWKFYQSLIRPVKVLSDFILVQILPMKSWRPHEKVWLEFTLTWDGVAKNLFEQGWPIRSYFDLTRSAENPFGIRGLSRSKRHFAIRRSGVKIHMLYLVS